MSEQPEGRLVYELHTTDDMHRVESTRVKLSEFLRRHGLDPMLAMVGNTIQLREHADGSMWLHTWQALPGHPLCEHCPACVKQERVAVPLNSDAVLPEGGAMLEAGRD